MPFAPRLRSLASQDVLQLTEQPAATSTREQVPCAEQILRLAASSIPPAGGYQKFLELDPDGIVTRKLIEGDIREKLLANKVSMETHMKREGTFRLSWIVSVPDSAPTSDRVDPGNRADERFPIAKNAEWRNLLGKHKIQVCLRLWWKDTDPDYLVDVSIRALSHNGAADQQGAWEQNLSEYRKNYVFDTATHELRSPSVPGAKPVSSSAG